MICGSPARVFEPVRTRIPLESTIITEDRSNRPLNSGNSTVNYVNPVSSKVIGNGLSKNNGIGKTKNIMRLPPESVENVHYNGRLGDDQCLNVMKTNSCQGCRWVWVKAVIRWKRGTLRNRVGDRPRHRGSKNCSGSGGYNCKCSACSRVNRNIVRRQRIAENDVNSTINATNNSEREMQIDDVEDIMDTSSDSKQASGSISIVGPEIAATKTVIVPIESTKETRHLTDNNVETVQFKSRAHSLFSNMTEFSLFPKSGYNRSDDRGSTKIGRNTVSGFSLGPILKRRRSSSNMYLSSVSRVINPQGISSSLQTNGSITTSSDVLSGHPRNSRPKSNGLTKHIKSNVTSSSDASKIDKNISTRNENDSNAKTPSRLDSRRSSSASSQRRHSVLDFMMLTRLAFTDVLPNVYWTSLVSK